MSRQDRQADLRRRMAEARSKLQVAGGSQSDGEKQTNAKVSLPSGILRKPKYASKNSAKHGESSGNNALGDLIGGYSSSEDEGVNSKPAAAETSKKRGVPVSSTSQDSGDGATRKRAKFSADVHVRAITSDKDGELIQASAPAADDLVVQKTVAKATSKAAEDNISDEVWDEFNALLGDDPVTVASGGDAETGKSIDTKPSPKQDTPSAAAAPPDTANIKKKKKRKKQSTDKSYDNETLTNVEQASYEARLARLMLMKSRRQKNKDESVAQDVELASLDFYDPSLAFHKDDEDDGEPNELDTNGSDGVAAASTDASIEQSGNTSQSEPRIFLSNILRKKRDAARLMSTRGGDGGSSKQEDGADSLDDGRWF